MNNSKTYELALQLGLNLKKLSVGEYHSECPSCGGKDRFIIWISSDRYWCRQCDSKGDAIQFCREFFGLSFQESCEKVGANRPRNGLYLKHEKFASPRPSLIPSEGWIKRASSFIKDAHCAALSNALVLERFTERGLSMQTIKRFQLGWNRKDLFESVDYWGIEKKEKKAVWLPKGLVIPSVFQEQPMKIKIRRSEWEKGDELPKYVEITGSRKCPSVFGNGKQGLMLLESELDAMLLAQEGGEVCTFMAIGSTRRKPDLAAHQLILSFDRVLFSLDYDDAGKQAYTFWKKLYTHLTPWPAPIAKSAGDAFKLNIDLREWIRKGLNLGGLWS